MVHIILLILKIIGILLLALLGLILLSVSGILFVPIRYRIRAVKEEENDAFSASAQFSWLLHILTIRCGYDKNIGCKIRLFGIVIYDFDKRDAYAGRKAAKAEKTADKEKKKEEKKKRKADKKRRQPEAETERAGRDARRKSIGLQQETADKGEASVQKKTETKGAEKPEASQQKMQDKHKLSRFFRMLYDKLKNIQYTFRRFCDKIKQIIEDIVYYKEVLEREESRQAFLCSRKQLAAIWKNIRPKKLKVVLEAGFDDPAVTGEFVAIYSMFYPWIYHTITLEPDFERFILKGTLFCKGRVTVFILLKAVWILYFNKNIRTFLQLWKKEEVKNG